MLLTYRAENASFILHQACSFEPKKGIKKECNSRLEQFHTMYSSIHTYFSKEVRDVIANYIQSLQSLQLNSIDRQAMSNLSDLRSDVIRVFSRFREILEKISAQKSFMKITMGLSSTSGEGHISQANLN